MTDETEQDPTETDDPAPEALDFVHNTHPAAVGGLLEPKEIDEAPEPKTWAPAPAANRPGGGYIATRGPVRRG